MSKSIADRIWSVLNDVEDLVDAGRRQEHPPLVVKPTPHEPADSLSAVAAEVENCRGCSLAATRTRTVPGKGAAAPDVLIIGEGPGADEDRTGLPFVGRAGKYLDKWLAAIDLDREANCFIGNIVKCRPPGNRDPLPEEMQACLPYLERQITLLEPKAILTLGRIATRILTGENRGITALRGQRFEYRGIPLIPTFHPSAVLRNSELRGPVWADLKQLRKVLDEVSANSV